MKKAMRDASDKVRLEDTECQVKERRFQVAEEVGLPELKSWARGWGWNKEAVSVSG